MKIAAIYFPISSVGGIASYAANLRLAAHARGDTFDVIVSGNHKTKTSELFPEPKLIRGGDSKIEVHGNASHHASRREESTAFLKENYDALLFLHPCPHPTKDYGTEDHWSWMYRLNMPKTVIIHDGYFSSYSWVKPVFEETIRRVFICQEAYQASVDFETEVMRQPFFPADRESYSTALEARNDPATTPVGVWLSQWKNIKGAKQFLEGLDAFPDRGPGYPVGLYNSGILYYQIRKTELWDRVVGVDYFTDKEYNGPRNTQYHGFVPYEEVPSILSRAWWCADLQGHAAKHPWYKKGSFNYTAVEALFYGAVPILHKNAMEAHLPSEFCCYVQTPEEFVKAVRLIDEKGPLGDRAKEWVWEHHDARAIYERLKGALV